ncbi:LytR/AlgR family response regulator transcription factor [Anaerosalibacter massiliensis]|uniref:LytTR family DNA-binding domain-containing protein n=1 Tax=Anaerosalibacter massiliensis TaxID=1347392 RepID=A0A9X2ML94_9FIRM|nr:LytTR family DNA-binding domain-containing protein [Anaerosalibacter massiliensis]MCR2045566.1 LytTR family DNA-binding domain-containing protein [Anaerosalibacter massiliensis]
MIKILILEDEDYTRKFIKKIVMENTSASEIFDTSSGKEAISLAREHLPEIAMLDVELESEDLNGLEISRIIHKISPETKIVFITGHSKYAVSAFDVHPYDYILKPINVKRLIETIVTLTNYVDKTSSTKSKGMNRIVVKNGGEMFFIAVKDILYAERLAGDTIIHDEKNTYNVQDSLQELENKLGDSFLRVHKSYIVNEEKIKKVLEIGERVYQIEFLNSDKVALMSRTGFKEFRERFNNLTL